MAYSAARVKATVKRALGKFKPVTYYRFSPGGTVYDPVTKTWSGDLPTPIDTHGIIVPPTQNYILRIGQDALSGDKETQVLYVETDIGAAPALGDCVKMSNGDIWMVQRPDRLAVDGEPVLYLALVTK